MDKEELHNRREKDIPCFVGQEIREDMILLRQQFKGHKDLQAEILGRIEGKIDEFGRRVGSSERFIKVSLVTFVGVAITSGAGTIIAILVT